jgi:hypothetical protein
MSSAIANPSTTACAGRIPPRRAGVPESGPCGGALLTRTVRQPQLFGGSLKLTDTESPALTFLLML